MDTTAVIVLGILVWILLAILLALFIGRMIRLRDRQGRSGTERGPPDPSAEAASTSGRTSRGTAPDPHRDRGP